MKEGHKMVAYNEENIKKNNEAMRKNWEALGGIWESEFKVAIEHINNALEQLSLLTTNRYKLVWKNGEWVRVIDDEGGH